MKTKKKSTGGYQSSNWDCLQPTKEYREKLQSFIDEHLKERPVKPMTFTKNRHRPFSSFN